MSEESAKAFIDRTKGDAELRAKAPAVEDAGARLALVNTEGFEVTIEEIGSPVRPFRRNLHWRRVT